MKIMKTAYHILHHSLERREEYTTITGSILRHLSFAQRAMFVSSFYCVIKSEINGC